MIRVLVADDSKLIRQGLKMLLEREPDIAVVGLATDGGEALQLTQELHPQIVLMDMRMPGIDGLAATRALAETSPQTPVLILTTFEDETVQLGLAAGAKGFVLKDSDSERMAAAIRKVVACSENS